MKKTFKNLSLILLLTILILNFGPIVASANTTVYVNEKVSVPISVSWGKAGAGFYFLSNGVNGPVGDPISGKYVKSFNTNITFTPKNVGKQEFTLKLDISDSGENPISVPVKTVTVNVVERPKQPKPNPKPDPKPSKPSTSLPQIDNTEQEKAETKVPEKTAEEIEREELAKRMKTPLIKDIEIVSNSERLKGDLLHTIEPESEKFEYSKVLPRNIENINLKIRTIAGDVKLDYKENVSFEEGKDSVEVIIKASQDKLEQEFKLTLKKPEESKFLVDHDSKKLKLIVDPYMDKSMETLGFEKMLINKDDESQGFYYSLDKKNYILVTDEENRAYAYLVDKDIKPVEEVFIVSNGENKVSFLVNRVLGEDDTRTLNENEYEIHEITISKLLTELDPGIKFNNSLGAWTFDEEGIITHGLGDGDEAELVYLDEAGNAKNAFVSFDIIPEEERNTLAIAGFSLWIVTLIAFIIYGVRTSKKRKQAAYY